MSSSGEEEDHGKRKEKRHMNRNVNGLACMAVKENLCTMVHSSNSKKSSGIKKSRKEVDEALLPIGDRV